MSEDTICGKCGTIIPAGAEACSRCHPVRETGGPLPVFLLVGVVCASLFLLSSSVVNVATAPSVVAKPSVDLRPSAYSAALNFLSQRHPNMKQFSTFDQSSVAQQGSTYVVHILADEVDSQGGVSRHFLNVELERSGEAWQLKAIRQ